MLSVLSNIFRDEKDRDLIKVYEFHNAGYDVYSKAQTAFSNDLVFPIQTGSFASNKIFGMLYDDEGNHISELNRSFCEYTGLFQIWKNRKSDYVGISHYRRCINFGKPLKNKENNGVVEVNLSQIMDIKDRCFDQNAVKKICREFDLVLPKKHYHGYSLKDQYSMCHIKDDFVVMEKAIEKIFPERSAIYQKIFNETNYIYIGGLFLAKYEIFLEAMEFIFAVLFECRKQILISNDNYQERVFAFLGERLLTAFFIEKITLKRVRSAERQMILFGQ